MTPRPLSRSDGQTVFSVGTVRIASIAKPANGLWMSQVACDLTDTMGGLFTERFVRTIKESCCLVRGSIASESIPGVYGGVITLNETSRDSPITRSVLKYVR